MNKIQLNNLINFTFLFLMIDEDQLYNLSSPDYIIEKWDKFIGYDIKDYKIISYFEFKEKIEQDIQVFDVVYEKDIYIWFNKWDKKGEYWYKIYPILKYLDEIQMLVRLSSRRNLVLTPNMIIGSFDKFFNIENVSKIEYNSLHPVLKKNILNWLSIKKIKREYILLILLNKR